jgi:hypothetical protein
MTLLLFFECDVFTGSVEGTTDRGQSTTLTFNFHFKSMEVYNNKILFQMCQLVTHLEVNHQSHQTTAYSTVR